jgi:signal transduction histidine kinase
MIRRMTRPMADLAAAAERLGRGEAVPPVPERGPEDVRQTTRAFNRMHDRLQRFVQDRTRMLAAISHDLRTPLTSLRLRAEFVDDEEMRSKILETLDEMQRMTEATLAFAREEARREDTRAVDLATLVESLCEDLRDLDMDVTYGGPPSLLYPCRSVSLKRAVRNLVENAVIYGRRARVALDETAAEVCVTIDDDGPGIPEADFERVFAPFVRLEESRSQETGGIGLGMAIARSIVRGHGGDITLANRTEGGLRVTLHLPRVGQP